MKSASTIKIPFGHGFGTLLDYTTELARKWLVRCSAHSKNERKKKKIELFENGSI